MSALLQYAKAYAEGGPVPLEVTFRESSADIAELEWKHQVGPQTGLPPVRRDCACQYYLYKDGFYVDGFSWTFPPVGRHIRESGR